MRTVSPSRSGGRQPAQIEVVENDHPGKCSACKRFLYEGALWGEIKCKCRHVNRRYQVSSASYRLIKLTDPSQ